MPDEATELLTTVFPDLDRDRLRRLLSTDAAFAYIKREITPRQQQMVHRLGIPGIGFRVENRRFYPGGADRRPHPRHGQHRQPGHRRHREVSSTRRSSSDLHAAGFATGHALEPVQLSIDLRVQHVVRDELREGDGEATGPSPRSAS